MSIFSKRSAGDKEFRKQLTELLGFKPGNLEFYIRAFTHKSTSVEIKSGFRASNERLEFLGDAILDAIVANYFFQRFPFEEEGFLTQIKSKMVNRGHLNALALRLGLPDLLKANLHNTSNTIFGDAFEALIGAIYLDKGYKKTEDFFVKKVINLLVDVDELVTKETNFKSLVLEYCQKHKYTVGYKVKDIGKPDQPFYEATLLINNEELTSGKGKSKKRAEQFAAKHYYEANLMEGQG